jgi:mannitol/fructose-specific phosphotransferase system IIA component (Ntr-type)
MKLSEIIHPECVKIPLAASTKEAVLRELVALLPSSADEDIRDDLLAAVLERENRMSTGIGQGIAIPHGKSERVSAMEIVFGISARPIDFEALDGDPVDVFFLLVSPPDMTGPHIKALAQISRMLSSDNIREELSGATAAEQVLDLFRREEALLDE